MSAGLLAHLREASDRGSTSSAHVDASTLPTRLYSGATAETTAQVAKLHAGECLDSVPGIGGVIGIEAGSGIWENLANDTGQGELIRLRRHELCPLSAVTGKVLDPDAEETGAMMAAVDHGTLFLNATLDELVSRGVLTESQCDLARDELTTALWEAYRRETSGKYPLTRDIGADELRDGASSANSSNRDALETLFDELERRKLLGHSPAHCRMMSSDLVVLDVRGLIDDGITLAAAIAMAIANARLRAAPAALFIGGIGKLSSGFREYTAEAIERAVRTDNVAALVADSSSGDRGLEIARELFEEVDIAFQSGPVTGSVLPLPECDTAREGSLDVGSGECLSISKADGDPEMSAVIEVYDAGRSSG